MGLFGWSLTPLSSTHYNARDPFSCYRPPEVIGPTSREERRRQRAEQARIPPGEEELEDRRRQELAMNDKFRGTYNMQLNRNVDILAPLRPTPFYSNPDVCPPPPPH